MADEEAIEGDPAEEQPVEEQQPVDQGAAFIPDILAKPKNDVYTALLVMGFVAFFVGIFLAGRELYECYDVQFWIFTKK